ncbi:hypothetical protein [uncultured Croceitalea sp.]|uniref:hypothetical protein n=1 Tax=uncultured Croceitalea sp. TaxID=1798908 RepID=UPI0033066BF0
MEQQHLQAAAENNEIIVTYSWIMQVLLAFDQLGNALAGGHHDSTISARIGFHLYDKDGDRGMFWSFLEFVVNLVFSPVDGPHHCRMAYCSDRDEEFRSAGFLAKIFLLIFVLPLSPVILLITSIIGLFKGVGTSYHLTDGTQIPKKDVFDFIQYCVNETDPCSYLQKLR